MVECQSDGLFIGLCYSRLLVQQNPAKCAGILTGTRAITRCPILPMGRCPTTIKISLFTALHQLAKRTPRRKSSGLTLTEFVALR